MSSNYTAKIVSVNEDEKTFVINKGSEDYIRKDDIYLIFELGDEIIDPDTDESLGRLEIVKGTARVSHIQEKMSTIISNEYIMTPERKEIKQNKNNRLIDSFTKTLYGFGQLDNESQTETIIASEKIIKKIPNVKVGDYVRKIYSR
ncbi:hypothetical protein ACJ8HH_10165 [Serratia sp. CY32780]|nr:hypothetical protein [Serratia marcescens]AWC72601.1 hypothetical protein AM368_21430 [Serratia marcescens]AWC90574.1 hypothetical protein AM370_17155 [Serratia marcescens]AWS57223.1 hypothetical protein AM369_02485 [Serratia marcescens]AWS68597.1 hypothetical protein AM378_09360 [Serratia marcescens]ELX7488804.1 hypothetical protein [Serratia marcescens]